MEPGLETRLIRIGNSRGIRLPKPLIEQAGLDDDVVLVLQDGGILIAPSQELHRAGWAQAAQQLATSGDGQLLDPPTTTRFDDQEWEW